MKVALSPCTQYEKVEYAPPSQPLISSHLWGVQQSFRISIVHIVPWNFFYLKCYRAYFFCHLIFQNIFPFHLYTLFAFIFPFGICSLFLEVLNSLSIYETLLPFYIVKFGTKWSQTERALFSCWDFFFHDLQRECHIINNYSNKQRPKVLKTLFCCTIGYELYKSEGPLWKKSAWLGVIIAQVLTVMIYYSWVAAKFKKKNKNCIKSILTFNQAIILGQSVDLDWKCLVLNKQDNWNRLEIAIFAPNNRLKL